MHLVPHDAVQVHSLRLDVLLGLADAVFDLRFGDARVFYVHVGVSVHGLLVRTRAVNSVDLPVVRNGHHELPDLSDELQHVHDLPGRVLPVHCHVLSRVCDGAAVQHLLADNECLSDLPQRVLSAECTELCVLRQCPAALLDV